MKTEDQINGAIADIKSKLQTLAQNHDKMVQEFNRQVVQNQAQNHQLLGQLAAYKEMLEKPELEVVEPAAET